MRMLIHLFASFLLLAALVGCISTERLAKEATSPMNMPTALHTNSATPGTAVSPTNTPPPCPVTIPNGSTPPGAKPSPDRHGNDALWVDVWPNNKILATPKYIRSDGSIDMKFGWYRGVPGKLTVEARRLDAPAPPVQVNIPGGYGDSGFQATGIYFPTEGCWEITGRVGAASLTFVTLVVKVPFEPVRGAVPEGLNMKDWDVTNLPKSIRLIYSSPIWGNGEFSIETIRGLPENRGPYPDAAKRQVRVRGQPGLCVQGTWDEQRQWRDQADAGALEWTVSGFSYRISHTGLGLHCEDLLRSAKSLR